MASPHGFAVFWMWALHGIEKNNVSGSTRNGGPHFVAVSGFEGASAGTQNFSWVVEASQAFHHRCRCRQGWDNCWLDPWATMATPVSKVRQVASRWYSPALRCIRVMREFKKTEALPEWGAVLVFFYRKFQKESWKESPWNVSKHAFSFVFYLQGFLSAALCRKGGYISARLDLP